MVRFQFGVVITFLATLCQGQVFAGGTLVTVIPANGGTVIAADTRLTLPQGHCDSFAKLVVPKVRKHTVVFQTGYGLWFKPKVSVAPAEICRYVQSASPALDMTQFLSREVDVKPQRPLTLAEIRKIANDCRLRVARYARENGPHALKEYIGQESVFQGVIVNYDVKHERTLIGNFIIRVDSVEEPLVGNVNWHEYAKADKTEQWVFGEDVYASKYAHTLGREFYGPAQALLDKPKMVSQLSLVDAKSVAMSIIAATERAATIKEPPRGIGGPIDVFTITEEGVEQMRYTKTQ